MKKFLIITFLLFILSCTQVDRGEIIEPEVIEETVEEETVEEEIIEEETVVEPSEEETVEEEIDKDTELPKPSSEIKLVAEKMDNSVKLTWTKYSGEMKYYKIVRSTTDATPTYSEEGYIKTVINPNETIYTDNSPEPGINYYAVTVVQPLNEYIDSNPITIEFPDPTETPDQDIVLTAKRTDQGILLNWDMYEGDFFQYKVVRSNDNPKPKYPNDRLIKTIPYVNKTSYLDRVAEPGVNYYAVTIIRPDKSKFTSEPVKV